MTDRWPTTFKCPHCKSETAWEKPGYGAIIGADLLATIVALPFFAIGVTAFVVAISVAMFGALFWLNNNTWCRNCSARIARAQVQSGSGH
jgi:hypothetical protein